MDLSMREGDACLKELRALVSRANRDDLASAQDILLQAILHEDGAERRSAILDGLCAELTRDEQAAVSSQEQRAFRTVLLSMIQRTRTMAESTER